MLDDKDLLNLQLTLIIVLLVTGFILVILVLSIISSRSTKIVKKNENEMTNDTNETQDVTRTISSPFTYSRDQAFEIRRNEKFSAASKSQDEVKSNFADLPTYDRRTPPTTDCEISPNDSTCDENESSDEVTENSTLIQTMLHADNFNKPGTHKQSRQQQNVEYGSFTDNTTAPAKDQICNIPEAYETAKVLNANYKTLGRTQQRKNGLRFRPTGPIQPIRSTDIHVFTVNPVRNGPAEEFVLGMENMSLREKHSEYSINNEYG